MNFENIEVILIKLNVTFKSNQHLNCLFFQPKIKLESMHDPERYKIKNEDTLFNKIKHLMDLAKDSKKNGLGNSIDFILIPEYSISGLEQINFILDKMKDSPVNEQILIGGVDGLKIDEFIKLLNNSSFDETIRNDMEIWIEKQPENKWVNTAIIIQKKEKEIKYYLQPKLEPSKWESIIGMLKGKWILFFTTNDSPSLNFFCSVCFDWIAENQNQKTIDLIPKKMDKFVNHGEHCLAFVPQYNEKPNHTEFVNSTTQFLSNSTDWSKVHGTNAIAFMINTAQLQHGNYGYTSIVINDARYNCGIQPLPDYSIIREDFVTFTNILFRQNKECIHAIELVLPFSTSTSSGSPVYPCVQTVVHTCDGVKIDDPRFPDPPNFVCGYIKVINDFIDDLEENGKFIISINGSDLEDKSKSFGKEEYAKLLYELRYNLKKENSIKIIKNFNINDSNYEKNCDEWKIEVQGKSFNELVSVLSIFRFIRKNVVIPKLLHGSLKTGSRGYSFLYLAKENYTGDKIYGLRKLILEIENIKMESNCKQLIIITESKIEKRKIRRYTEFDGEFENFTNCNPIYTYYQQLEANLMNEETYENAVKGIISTIGGRHDA